MRDKNKAVLTVSSLVLTGSFLIGMPRFDAPLTPLGFLFLLIGIAYLYQMLPSTFALPTDLSQGNPSTDNFTLPLRGKTPAEVAGIKVEGENKWITIIQDASAHQD